MNLNGYDAWKTTEPAQFEEAPIEREPFELDEVTEEWNEFWFSRTVQFSWLSQALLYKRLTAA